MRIGNLGFELSAADLGNHLGCHHLTQLNIEVANGLRMQPDWYDPAWAILQQRGLEFERIYLDHLRRLGLEISEPGPDEEETGVARTASAMHAGADIIYQASLRSTHWNGRADFLQRVDRPSVLGAWSYEVLDTKLARETRASTILQLCLYSHMVANVQGSLPEYMHVVTPSDGFECLSYRVEDFLAYHRLVERRLETAINSANGEARTYPEPVPQCELCRWRFECEQRRRGDDHLCLVAGISKLQMKEIRSWGVSTLTGLATLPLPFDRRPARGAVETYERVREQARIQLEGREANQPLFELLPITQGQGLSRLPEPSPGDIFFDIESDQFVGTAGLEYLLGWTVGTPEQAEYRKLWATDAASEKAAFEAFMDYVMERWERYPDLHIYHFAPYEPAALKRLMGRYATREDVLDRLLRAERFIDVYGVTRQALRASVERYSLKDLEIFYGFERQVPLTDASKHLRAFEHAIELGRVGDIPDETPNIIEGYNREDCLSTMLLRGWLEQLRAHAIGDGCAIARPAPKAGDPSEDIDERQRRVQALYERLAGDVPPDPDQRTDEQQARWLLANMLDWHRREKKAIWWEYFRLNGLPDEDLLDEKAGLAGLAFHGTIARPGRSVIDRYRFPAQECEIRAGDELQNRDQGKCGSVASIDAGSCFIDIKKGPSIAGKHPPSVFKYANVNDGVKAEAIMRLAEWVADHGIDAEGPYRAARNLLLCRAPTPAIALEPGQPPLAYARTWVEALDHGVLPIQGPPGSGKTHTGANMITSLVRAGRKVGIVALSHKVIRNLLNKVVEIAAAERTPVQCIQKVTERSDEPDPSIIEVTDNSAIENALRSGVVSVAAGTAWLWSRAELFEAVDVLFVDEAGQLSLVDVLAVSQSARSIVLLGDPQQLKQPLQGSHPEGTDVSALEHILGNNKTIPAGSGIFLEHTFRLHPSICAFNSELFYEGRLHSRPNLDRQVLTGNTPFQGAGLWFVPVEHEGNQSCSPEEVERVSGLVSHFVTGEVFWTDEKNDRHAITLSDILIIAPYNAQVAELTARLPGARIGTVDKFQGQEAPIVIFSMATSSPEEAPRGMEFLYSLNRLNVGVSRARAACILVASPALFEPDCKSPAQMRLANAFCRYIETAHVIL